MSSLKKTGKWWVLAVGEGFGEAGFEERDECRAELLRRVNAAGVFLDENVWVYDEDECAQLVLKTCESRESAEETVRGLGNTGLSLKITMEFE
ncbi:hypothetical protein [Maridesulfovibrio sp. FT414]|uniref:hypothetical protein n=1 Tax=Maridesulfovibrio sp. FT414 TaxID=2979469 RepID=UPI003D805861